ncbi:MAG: TRAP transporter substrate-binding protein DctP [Brevinema sp.]
MLRYSLLYILLLSHCSGFIDKKENHITLTFAHHYPENSLIHESLLMFKQKIESQSKGEVRIHLFGDSILDKNGQKIIEKVRSGNIDFAIESDQVLELYNPEFKAFLLPYIFDNNAHYHKTMNSEISDIIFKNLMTNNLLGLGYLDRGDKSFYTKLLPIINPENIKNKKFAVTEHYFNIRMVQIMGGKPIQINSNNINHCILSRNILGAEGSIMNFVEQDQNKALRYFSLDKHTKMTDFIIVNNQTWNNLSIKNKDIIKDALQEMMTNYHIKFEEQTEELLSIIDDSGVIIYQNIDRTIFQRAMKPLYEEALSDIFISHIIQGIMDLKEK